MVRKGTSFVYLMVWMLLWGITLVLIISPIFRGDFFEKVSGLFGGFKGTQRELEIKSDIYVSGIGLDASVLYLRTAFDYSAYQAMYEAGLYDDGNIREEQELLDALERSFLENMNRYTMKTFVFTGKYYSLPEYEPEDVSVGKTPGGISFSLDSGKEIVHTEPVFEMVGLTQIEIRAPADHSGEYEIDYFGAHSKALGVLREFSSKTCDQLDIPDYTESGYTIRIYEEGVSGGPPCIARISVGTGTEVPVKTDQGYSFEPVGFSWVMEFTGISGRETGYLIGHNEEIETIGEELYYWNNPKYTRQVDIILTEQNRNFIESVLEGSIMYQKIDGLPDPVYVAFGEPIFGDGENLCDLQSRFSEILLGSYMLDQDSTQLNEKLSQVGLTQDQFILTTLTHESVHAYFSYKYGIEKYERGQDFQEMEEGTAYSMQLLEFLRLGLQETEMFRQVRTQMVNNLEGSYFLDENYEWEITDERIRNALINTLSTEDYNFFFG